MLIIKQENVKGGIPDLTANFDTGYEATALSEFNANYHAYNAFQVGSYGWATWD